MNKWPLQLIGGKEAKRLDQLAQENGIAADELMRRAGQAAWQVLSECWPAAKSLMICCGPGNNGGDGFILARLAKSQGLKVTLFQEDPAYHPPTSEAQHARAAWLAAGGEIHPFPSQPLQADVLVDALFGTGVHLPLPASYQRMITAMNESGIPILALDLPSGLDADTGQGETSIHATATSTFIGLKIGLFLGKGLEKAGNIYFDDLGVPAHLYTQITPMAWRLDYEELIKRFPARSPLAHKGDSGHVCIIGGGQSGYSGAVCLAGEAALRAGAGLVSAVVAPESLSLLARGPAELMSYGIADEGQLSPLLEKATVIVLGPGLSQNHWATAFFKAALQTTKPLLIDADGLNLLAKMPEHRENWVLTPHPGEAARLLGISTQEVQEDRLTAARELQRKYGGVIVLKGAGTMVVAEKDIFLYAGGLPILATGGTGDVLSGLIGGLLAQKLPLDLAAQLGVSVHAAAAEIEQALGERGMLASDLFLHIRSLLNTLNHG